MDKTTQAQPAAVSDAEIDRICYLATEIRFAKTDDAAQAVIDQIRAILALRPQAAPDWSECDRIAKLQRPAAQEVDAREAFERAALAKWGPLDFERSEAVPEMYYNQRLDDAWIGFGFAVTWLRASLTAPQQATPEPVHRSVYIASNKNAMCAFASRDLAERFVSNFGGATAGGMTVFELTVIGATPEPERITVQEAWEAAGGNPGIKASKADLLEALRQLDKVCDEATPEPVTRCGITSVVRADFRATVPPGTLAQMEAERVRFERRLSGEDEATPEPVGEPGRAFYEAHCFAFDVRTDWGSLPTAVQQRYALADAKLRTRPAAAADPGFAALASNLAERLAQVERERDYWSTRARTMVKHAAGDCWYWQGDGEDHLESLVNSLPVVIRADQLRELLAAAPAVPEGWEIASYAAGDITIQRMAQIDGSHLWKIAKNGNVLNKQGEWEWEPMPSSRDDDFLARCRYATLDEVSAMLAAAQAKGGA
jgi:hypothetical protein